MTVMPPTNARIAALFDDLADVLEIKKDGWFKIRAYRRAAEAIRGLPETLESLVREGRDLKAIPGIGEAIARKIGELVATGRVATYERVSSDDQRDRETKRGETGNDAECDAFDERASM